jgi:hypothetical protein
MTTTQTQTDDELDLRRLTEISRELPRIDLDEESAERIAHRAALDLGKRPPIRRGLELALASVIVTVYLMWVIGKVLELLG